MDGRASEMRELRLSELDRNLDSDDVVSICKSYGCIVWFNRSCDKTEMTIRYSMESEALFARLMLEEYGYRADCTTCDMNIDQQQTRCFKIKTEPTETDQAADQKPPIGLVVQPAPTPGLSQPKQMCSTQQPAPALQKKQMASETRTQHYVQRSALSSALSTQQQSVVNSIDVAQQQSTQMESVQQQQRSKPTVTLSAQQKSAQTVHVQQKSVQTLSAQKQQGPEATQVRPTQQPLVQTDRTQQQSAQMSSAKQQQRSTQKISVQIVQVQQKSVQTRSALTRQRLEATQVQSIQTDSTQQQKRPEPTPPCLSQQQSVQINETQQQQPFQQPAPVISLENIVRATLVGNGNGICVHCGRRATFDCSRCRDPYCSVECQSLDWPRHRLLCIAVPPLTPRVNNQPRSTAQSLNLANIAGRKRHSAMENGPVRVRRLSAQTVHSSAHYPEIHVKRGVCFECNALTREHCTECQIPLCITEKSNCFFNYHQSKDIDSNHFAIRNAKAAKWICKNCGQRAAKYECMQCIHESSGKQAFFCITDSRNCFEEFHTSLRSRNNLNETI